MSLRTCAYESICSVTRYVKESTMNLLKVIKRMRNEGCWDVILKSEGGQILPYYFYNPYTISV